MKKIFQIIFVLFNTFLVAYNRTAITAWPYIDTIPGTYIVIKKQLEQEQLDYNFNMI